MFGHYPFILKQHHVALESAIRSHSVVSGINANLLAAMYKLALAGLDQPVKSEGCYTSTLLTDTATVSSVTDAKTGLWIQLAKVKDQPNAYLTLGQKWAMEQYIPAHGNVSTLMW